MRRSHRQLVGASDIAVVADAEPGLARPDQHSGAGAGADGDDEREALLRFMGVV